MLTEAEVSAPCDHVVHIYDDATSLLDAIGGDLVTELAGGATIIVIARRERIEAFEAIVERHGLDLLEHQRQGTWQALDAVETVRSMLHEGTVGRDAFDGLIGRVMREAVANGAAVHAYGEMVEVLWEDGLVNAATDLETLWNDLRATTPFTLRCAYRSSAFDDLDLVPAVHKVCGLHSTVIGWHPAFAPTTPTNHASRTFSRSRRSPAAVRTFVNDTLVSWDHAHGIDDAMLVASELATNAILHAQSTPTVTLTRTDGVIRIAVTDDDPAAPQLVESPAALGGRGMVLVEAVSDRWGTERAPSGKVVWAELAAPATHQRS